MLSLPERDLPVSHSARWDSFILIEITKNIFISSISCFSSSLIAQRTYIFPPAW
jgi:hypothetical protein